MIDVNSQPDAAAANDTAGRQVGMLYAKALLGATEQAGATADVLDELESVLNEALKPNPRLQEHLGSTFVAHEKKVEMLDRVFGGKISTLSLNFLKVLSAHGRLGDLQSVLRVARQSYDEMQGRVHVMVQTAAPIDDTASESIRNALRAVLSKEPVLDVTVNPDLIGGLILRVGDRVYDGSVARQLEQVRQKMIDRSVHEIQSRRDRFGNTSGN